MISSSGYEPGGFYRFHTLISSNFPVQWEYVDYGNTESMAILATWSLRQNHRILDSNTQCLVLYEGGNTGRHALADKTITMLEWRPSYPGCKGTLRNYSDRSTISHVIANTITKVGDWLIPEARLKPYCKVQSVFFSLSSAERD
uniref:Uncharacterized protein n=1 Tax=Timema poppense TaxID=170557 RepID=A0A7R9CTJ2_TIMPO|nr:unnamed protein product [Timema poppensis]